MNVEIGAEAALFPEKEYINRIAVAVQFLHSYICERFIYFGSVCQICCRKISGPILGIYSYNLLTDT
jgi:hypothetical protein